MKPVIALVGRPNVGKSTLFNRLTKSRDALVADQPGLTRDRKFGEGKLGDKSYIVIDTGGLSGEDEGVDAVMATQSWLAVEQANIVFFLTDARAGLNAVDQEIARRLRMTGKTIHVVANKIDGMNADIVIAEFHNLGLGVPFGISAEHGRGVTAMINKVLEALPDSETEEQEQHQHKGIRVAVVGRPNVGKSTLVNRILGEERVVTFDLPGTTRDSIYLPFVRDEQDYVLIDTAGVRRRGKISEAIEKFSVIKTLQAVEDANVVIVMLDASEGITDQDASLLGFVLDVGRALVIAVNKWDGLETEQRDKIRRELEVKLPFINFAKIHFISALHGSGVGDLFGSINVAYKSAMAKFPTPKLTRLLEDLVSANPPPLSKGRRIKLRYAHQGGQNPPIIVIHGTQVDSVPGAYKRYLMNAFSKHLRLKGTPLRIEFKAGKNPYEGRKNVLTERQQQKRKRLMKHVKSKK